MLGPFNPSLSPRRFRKGLGVLCLFRPCGTWHRPNVTCPRLKLRCVLEVCLDRDLCKVTLLLFDPSLSPRRFREGLGMLCRFRPCGTWHWPNVTCSSSSYVVFSRSTLIGTFARSRSDSLTLHFALDDSMWVLVCLARFAWAGIGTSVS